MATARSPYFVLLPVLLCAALWGSAFPAIKTVYAHWAEQGIEVSLSDRWLFAGIRFVAAGLLVLALAKQPWKEWQQSPKGWVALLAVSQTLLQYLFFYLGVSLSSGSLTALMASTGSFWWMILAPILLGTAWPRMRQWLVLVVGAVGVALAVYAPGAGAGSAVLGSLCIALATFFGALGVVVISKVKETMGSRAATGYALFIGGVGLCLVGLPAWGNVAQLFDGFVILMTLWLVIVSALAFAVWNYLSLIYPVPLLASCRFLIPISGVTQSLIFLEGETAGWGLMIGGVLVIGSMFTATLMKRD